MFGISFEHVLVLGIIMLFVGPKRLPQLGHTLGKAIKNFKDGVAGVEDATFRKVDENQVKIPRSSVSSNSSDSADALGARETPPPRSEPGATDKLGP